MPDPASGKVPHKLDEDWELDPYVKLMIGVVKRGVDDYRLFKAARKISNDKRIKDVIQYRKRCARANKTFVETKEFLSAPDGGLVIIFKALDMDIDTEFFFRKVDSSDDRTWNFNENFNKNHYPSGNILNTVLSPPQDLK